jgi:hypothetical protein
MCSHNASDVGRNKPLELLEREITELASHIHAATCRWLGLIAEFDRREGWAAWGYRSCAPWLSWRCSIAPGAAREHVRVARRLESLPLIRTAFGEGRLSYSKVRALTRVETVEREEELLTLAEHASAAQLERLIRAYRGVVAVEREEPERWVSWSHDVDGSLLLRARLPAEEGALVVAALEAGREAALARAKTPADDVPAETPHARAAEDGPAETPAQVAVDVPAETPHARAAVDVPGETPGQVAVDVPAETPAQVAVDVPTETHVPSGRELLADALLLMADTMLAQGPASRTSGDRHQVVVHVDADMLAGRPGAAGRCELADGSPLAPETVRRLACDAGVVPLVHRNGRPLDVGRKTRSILPALRRALAARDRGCRFPGCDRARVDAHHIRHWAHGGETKLENLVHLCRHHHRLVHEGGFGIERRPGGELVFSRPDGRRLTPCPPAPPGRAAAVRIRRVSPDACVPLSGDRMDLALAVDWMVTIAPPPRRDLAGTGAKRPSA